MQDVPSDSFDMETAAAMLVLARQSFACCYLFTSIHPSSVIARTSLVGATLTVDVVLVGNGRRAERGKVRDAGTRPFRLPAARAPA